jgi:TP901 family phage tail tape measure protein
MAVEELGLEVAVKGFAKFLAEMKLMDSATGGLAKGWSALGGVAGIATSALAGLATIGIAAVAAAAAAAVAAVAALAAGMIKLGVDGVKAAAEFQDQMVLLNVAAGDAAGGFDKLHDAALKVGGDVRLVGVTASGAADAMTNLYKAGLTTGEIFGDLDGYMAGTAELGGALRASIDLAAASELDMGQAADLAAIALSTFGAEMVTEEDRANFVVRAMNNLVQTADASVASVSDLAEAMKNIGPTAASFGFSLEETNNALAVLSTRGIRGAEAGTALKSMMTNLMRPTNQVTGALDELGVSLFDSEGNMKSLRTIIGDLGGSLDGLTEQQRLQYIQTLAGSYGMKSLNTLLAEGVEGWDEMALAVGDAATIQEIAAARAATYTGKMEALKGVMETLKIRIGEALLPVLTDLAGKFADFVTTHGPLLVAIFEKIGEVLGVVLPGIFEAFIALLEGKFWVALGNIRKVIGEVFGPEGTAIFDEWMGKIGGIIAWVEENWPIIRDTILTTVQTVYDWFIENWPIIRDAALEVMQAIKDWVDEDWPTIRDTILEAAQAIYDWFIENWPVIQATVLTVFEVIKAVVETVAGIFATVIVPQFQAAFASITEALGALGLSWSDIWNIIKEVLIVVALAIGALIIGMIAVVTALATAVAETAAWVTEQWTLLAQSWSEIFGGIQMMLEAWWLSLQGLFTGNLTMLQEGFSQFWQSVLQITTSTALAIWSVLVLAFGTILTFIGSFIKAVIQFFTDLAENLVGGSIIPDMMQAMLTAITEGCRSILELFTGFVADVQSAFTSVDWASVGAGIINGIKAGVEAAARALAEAAAAAAAAALAAAKAALGIGSPSSVFQVEVGRPIMQGIAAGIADLTPTVQAQIAAAITPKIGGLGGGSTTSSVANTYNYNLTTQSVTRPGGLALEFATMGMASR